jgi:hypothetical protein
MIPPDANPNGSYDAQKAPARAVAEEQILRQFVIPEATNIRVRAERESAPQSVHAQAMNRFPMRSYPHDDARAARFQRITSPARARWRSAHAVSTLVIARGRL